MLQQIIINKIFINFYNIKNDEELYTRKIIILVFEISKNGIHSIHQNMVKL